MSGEARSLPLTGERTTPDVPEENYWFRRHVAAYRFARRFAGGRVLDAGTGEGYGAALLGRRALVTAIEVDAGTIEHAARRYGGVRFVRADLCALPFAEATLDAVIALQVLEHLPCADGFLDECRNALRAGGVLALSTPNRATFAAGLNPFHVREYDADELRSALEEHFGHVTLMGVEHRAGLAQLDRFLGESVQHRLAGKPYRKQPLWLRAALRTVTSRDFRVTRDAVGSLDLLAVCRTPGPGYDRWVSRVSTVYLGQFTWEHANRIAEGLEEAGITWWCKNPGTVSYVLFMEWGPRIFVDKARLEEAREIARSIAPDGVKER